MFDNLINTVKGEISDKFNGEFGLSSDQADRAIDIAKDTVVSGVKSEANSGNVSSFLNMFNGQQSIGSSNLVANLMSSYAGNLISKLGLDSGVANNISKFAMPFIMNKINDGTPDSGMSSSDLSGMIGDGLIGGLKDKLGGLFK